MQFGMHCVDCLLSRELKTLRNMDDKKKARECALEILDFFSKVDRSEVPPYISAGIKQIHYKYFGCEDKYADIKRESNDYVMSIYPKVRKIINESDDPLLTALKFARIGNYIDYSALGDTVNDSELCSLISSAPKTTIDPVEYSNLKHDLTTAKSLTYVSDNAGEIAFDRLVIEILMAQYPDVEITLLVRGGPIVNDATKADADQVGLTDLVHVVGTTLPLAGVHLKSERPEVLALFENSDIILTKGQGNFETLSGCGKNIYYVFLCKCDMFTEMFNVPKLTGMFINERRLGIEL